MHKFLAIFVQAVEVINRLWVKCLHFLHRGSVFRHCCRSNYLPKKDVNSSTEYPVPTRFAAIFWPLCHVQSWWTAWGKNSRVRFGYTGLPSVRKTRTRDKVSRDTTFSDILIYNVITINQRWIYHQAQNLFIFTHFLTFSIYLRSQRGGK
jgi:hypothetical protein